MIGVVRIGALVMLAAALSARTAMTQEPKGGQRPEIEFLTPYGPPTRPFSPAVRVGNLIFLSGQIGVRADAGGTLVPGGIKPETRQTLENIRDVLQRVGSSMERVVKCTVMLADMAEWGAMNEVYATFFPTNKPARSALGASGLALNARVEIECIAVAG
ncbi:MAG TPA: RidA family protein [Gemmatimonadaceae bacterium]|nr:RidA family protein [Gemmatimonadaceae bacterium]